MPLFPGGENNAASGPYSFAAGQRAKATHAGAFVWADRTAADFASTSTDQFLIRASGGVGIGTNAPSQMLTVAGTIESTSGGYKFPDGTTQTTAASGGNTLDAAYDQGGAGAGRTITADAGAVTIAGTDGFVVTGTSGSGAIPATGAGVRMMWYPNKAAFRAGVVSGAQWSDANIGNRSTVGGGEDNTASDTYTTVGGGNANTALAVSATVGGGASNFASGTYSTVPGGLSNTAQGSYSFAAGQRAKANHAGAFVWADQTAADFASTAADQFLVRAAGGVGLGTNAPGAQLDVLKSSATVAVFNRTTDDGTVISIQQDGVEEGTISVATTTVSYNAFTGSHYAWTDRPIERGSLVSLTGVNQRLHGDPESEIIYGIMPASTANDSRILGAYLGLQEPGRPPGPDNPHLVMAVGNGEMWIADDGTDVRVGDYLISSGTAGHATVDRGEHEIAHIAARAAEPVHWDNVRAEIAGRKHKKISVFFESFVRNHKTERLERRIAELERSVARLESMLAPPQGAVWAPTVAEE